MFVRSDENRRFQHGMAVGEKVKLSLQQAVEAHRVVRGRGSHII
jgi:hypothetical protein